MLLAPDEIDERLFDGARCFHFGSIGFINEPCASAQRRALDIACARGLMITFDPNYRPTLWRDADAARAVIQDSFRFCHLAKISEEEWETATGERDLDAGIAAVLAKGVELLVISRGARGAIATNGDYRIELDPPAVPVVETTGAGDGFMAAMIARLLPERERLGTLARIDGDIVREALAFANAVGALTCTRPGAIPALPTRAEVERFIATRGEG